MYLCDQLPFSVRRLIFCVSIVGRKLRKFNASFFTRMEMNWFTNFPPVGKSDA